MGNMATAFRGLFGVASEEDPLVSMRAVEAWAARLPANDPLAALRNIAAVLEGSGARGTSVTAGRVQALFALDGLSQPLQAIVLGQYQVHLRSDVLSQSLWQACNDLVGWFCLAYEQACGAIEARRGHLRWPLPAHGVFARMFHYRKMQVRLGLFRYQSWIPGYWKSLHGAYAAALASGAASQPFDLGQPSGAYSAEQEFIQALLLQRIDTGNQTVSEVEWAAEWLRNWVAQLRLTGPSGVSGGFWLDLGQGQGLLSQRPDAALGHLCHLDVTPLRAALRDHVDTLWMELASWKGTPAERKVRNAQFKLAVRLQLLWQPNAGRRNRRAERRDERRRVVATTGWTPIVAALRAGNQDGFAIIGRKHHPHVARPGAPGAPSGGQATVVSLGQPDWQVRDSSDSGVCILSIAREAWQLQAGALLALRDEGDMRWQAGIVRRLRRRTTDVTELGVEIISRHALLADIAQAGTCDSGYSVDGVDVGARNPGFPALYLSPHDRGQPAPLHSLILPAGEFTAGRKLVLDVEGTQRDIRLGDLIEHGEDWVWAGVEISGAAACI